MIIATFNYAFYVTVKVSGRNTIVWQLSSGSGQYSSKDLPAGQYTVEVESDRTPRTANVSAAGMVGVVGGSSDFQLQTANPASP